MNEPLRFAAALVVALGLGAGCDVPPPDNEPPDEMDVRMEDGGVRDLAPRPVDTLTAGQRSPVDLENPPLP